MKFQDMLFCCQDFSLPCSYHELICSPADGQMHTYAPAHSTVFSVLDQLLRADAPPHMVHGLKDVTSRREVALGVLNTSAVSATELVSPMPAQANTLRWAPFLFFCLPGMSSFSA